MDVIKFMNATSVPQKKKARPSERSAVDVLVQQIKQLIQEQGLTEGDCLPSERELGERFDASRNTVREAIRILIAYGVVEVKPKVGAVIINRHLEAVLDLFSFQLSISRESFIDVQGFRRLIEIGSVDDIFRNITADHIAKLRQVNEDMRSASGATEAAALDFEFHLGLLAAAGNKTVSDVYQIMRPIVERLMELGKESPSPRETFEQHSEILDAVEKRDRLAFQYLMSKHLQVGLQFIDQAVSE